MQCLFSVLKNLLLDSGSSVPMEPGSSHHDTTNTKLEISYAGGRAATHSTVTNIRQIKICFGSRVLTVINFFQNQFARLVRLMCLLVFKQICQTVPDS